MEPKPPQRGRIDSAAWGALALAARLGSKECKDVINVEMLHYELSTETSRLKPNACEESDSLLGPTPAPHPPSRSMAPPP